MLCGAVFNLGAATKLCNFSSQVLHTILDKSVFTLSRGSMPYLELANTLAWLDGDCFGAFQALATSYLVLRRSFGSFGGRYLFP